MILLTWRADIKLNCIYQQVPIHEAEKVLLKDKFEQIFEEDVTSRRQNGQVNMHALRGGQGVYVHVCTLFTFNFKPHSNCSSLSHENWNHF